MVAIRIAATIAGAAFFACSMSSSTKPSTEAAAPVVEPARAEPRLVVLLVFDQLPSWVLDQQIDHLAEGGLFRTATARGRLHRRSHYPYAVTLTAPDEPTDKGTSHGSPWDYDREVPVLYFGAGVSAAPPSDLPVSQVRGAATVAALLGIDFGPHDPLPGIH